MKKIILSIIATLFFTAANADVIGQSLSKASEIGTSNLCNIEPLEPVVTISIK